MACCHNRFFLVTGLITCKEWLERNVTKWSVKGSKSAFDDACFQENIAF